jgi:phosphate transport system protein
MTRPADEVLRRLRERALRMGSLAEAILSKSVRAVFERERSLAQSVGADDLPIDRLDLEIDDAVLKALALQAPVAGDLREVIAIKMIATDLERVGDIARNIAKSALRLCDHPGPALPPELSGLATAAQRILRQALDSFSGMDGAAARRVLEQDDAIDSAQDALVARSVREISQLPERASFDIDVIFIAKNLERIADHATNIAEDVILVAEARNVKHASKLR